MWMKEGREGHTAHTESSFCFHLLIPDWLQNVEVSADPEDLLERSPAYDVP